jgi:hypothetical protein
LGVGAAIRVPTTGALGLRQGRINSVDQRHHKPSVVRFK